MRTVNTAGIASRADLQSRRSFRMLATLGLTISMIAWLAPAAASDQPTSQSQTSTAAVLASTVEGASSIAQLTTATDYSYSLDAPILRLYQAFFDRQPDLSGAKYWLDVRRQGFDALEIAGFMAQSGEFNSTYSGTSNARFTELVYTNVLGRNFDQEGYRYWLGLLDKGPRSGGLDRSGMVFYVTDNDEFRSRFPFGSPSAPEPVPPVSASSIPGPQARCAKRLKGKLRTETHLVNTASACDYWIDGTVSVIAGMTIDPGVVLQGAKDSRLVVDGGQLRAIGSSEQRIVFRGGKDSRGYWRGLEIDGGADATLSYVDVRDAGQRCTIIFCPDVALQSHVSTLSFTNSTVSNSSVIGMSIGGETRLTQFASNSFFGNEIFGLAVHPSHVSLLDQSSDYLGQSDPNGSPFIDLTIGKQTSGGRFEWKKLNAPYRVSIVTISGGLVNLEPGVELVMASEAVINVQGNGVLHAQGTATSPVVIRGEVEEAGFWNAIRFERSTRNSFDHVWVRHSGEPTSLIAYGAALSLSESEVELRNTIFTDGQGWIARCDHADIFTDASVVDFDATVKTKNMGGGIDTDCSP